jgi:hypothetical protein
MNELVKNIHIKGHNINPQGLAKSFSFIRKTMQNPFRKVDVKGNCCGTILHQTKSHQGIV